MSAPNDGGPAFPRLPITFHGESVSWEAGMSLRDYFAAKALNGICASGPGAEWADGMIATECFRLADAMLKARSAS